MFHVKQIILNIVINCETFLQNQQKFRETNFNEIDMEYQDYK